MTTSPRRVLRLRSSALLAGLIGLALPGAAVDLNLSQRFEPGQSYQLSIRSETHTNASSRGPDHPTTFREEVAVDYEATVVVLAVGADGCPVREQHRNVSVTFTRPDETGSLFSKPSTFQVERVGNAVRITTGGDRVSRDIERVLGNPLRRSHDRCARAAWLEPGRPVEVGESWPLDAGFARRLLRDRGLSGVVLADPPTATLELQDGWLTVRYSIPVSRARVRDLPPNTETAGSRALLEGTHVVSDASGAPSLENSSNLAFDLGGAVHTFGLGRSFGWKLRRMESLAQRVRMLPQLAIQR